MKRSFAVLCTVASIASASTASAVSVEKSPLAGLVEGLALGDVDGDGRDEVFALLRDGTSTDAAHTNGSVALFDAKGTLRWEKLGGKYLSGGVTNADYDGDGRKELSYCEAVDDGRCFVLDGDGSTLFQTGPLFYPGISGSAPAAADLTGDGADDLVVTSWGGTIAAFDGPTGFELWRYEAYTELGELFHCNPTLVDLNGDHVLDVVALGSQEGKVVAVDGSDGSLLWASTSFRDVHGNYSRGNGLLVTTLRPGHGKELLISLSGAAGTSAVFGLSRNGEQLFRTNVPGNLSYMAPAAADTNGDGKREIFLQNRNGDLSEIDGAGRIVNTTSIGTASWVPPSFIDVDADGIVEVVATSTTGVRILKGGAMKVVHEFENLGDGLHPSPVVADVERDGKTEMFLGAWFDNDLFRVQFDRASWHRWDTLGGSIRHEGEHALALPTGSLVAQVATHLMRFEAETAALSGKLAKAAETVVEDLQSAAEMLSRGFPQSAIGDLRKAEKSLAKMGDSYFESRLELGRLAVVAARELAMRVEANQSSDWSKLMRARELLVDAETELAEMDVERALISTQQAVAAIRMPVGVEGNYCAELSHSEPYLSAQCRLLKAAYDLGPSEQLAQAAVLAGLSLYPALNIPSSLGGIAIGVALLNQESAQGLQIAEAARIVARLYVDERRIASFDEEDFSRAENSFDAGEDALRDGNAALALAHFSAAAAAAAGPD